MKKNKGNRHTRPTTENCFKGAGDDFPKRYLIFIIRVLTVKVNKIPKIKEEMMMKKFIGTKIVEAKPMTRGKYNEYRGWTIPADENPEDEGYLVKYLDGYESWSPEKQFNEAYRECDNMTFGLAIEALKKGKKVARKGWNGKNQYIQLATGISYKSANGDIVNCEHDAIGNNALAFVGTSGVQMGWLASQADMLSEDWVVVE